MREIKKMSSIQSMSGKQIQNLSGEKPQKYPPTSSLSSNRKGSEQIKSKQKKIAEKAYKGFDILAKLLSNLYKAFINVHIADINRK